MKTRIKEGCQRRMSNGQSLGLTKHMGIGEYSDLSVSAGICEQEGATSVLRVQYDMIWETIRDSDETRRNGH